MDDPYNLQRFVNAQDPVFKQVCAELQSGRKRGHWMWFIFPQIAGLGHSATAQRFAIASLEEARAYLQHRILSTRLSRCTQIVNFLEGATAEQIFGHVDCLKFRSSMTLFSRASSGDDIFDYALQRYFDGEPDDLTLAKL